MRVAQPTHERIRGNMPRLHLNPNRMIKDRGQGERLRRALENPRKQYQWGDISDDEYRRERGIIMRQLKVHTSTTVMPTHLPNLERAANFLEDLPALWLHPGVTHEEREALVRQVFLRITIAGKEFVDIEPKPEYAPLFATMVTAQKVGYQELDSPPSPPRTQWNRLRSILFRGRFFFFGNPRGYAPEPFPGPRTTRRRSRPGNGLRPTALITPG